MTTKNTNYGTCEKLLIGGKEFISIPELNIKRVLARIDTGARTSSIHCAKVWIERFDNKPVLCVHLLKKTTRVTRFNDFKIKTVKSSNGLAEKRYAIRLKIKLGNKIYKTEFTLAKRDKMNYPVLLGRKFLKNRFWVDVSADYLLSKK